MKRILIVINNMRLGGIQKSLLEALKVLSKIDEFSIDLFCCNKEGEFFLKIPEEIKVLPENKWAKLSELAVNGCRKLGIKYYLFRVIASLWTKLFNKEKPARFLCNKIGNLGEYDVAISYSQPISDKAFAVLTNEMVLNCCTAKKKITFVHCDFEKYGGNTFVNRTLYKKFDIIAAVSNSVGEILKKCIPDIKEKIRTIYNFCDAEEIVRLANINPIGYSTKTLISVARLSEEKGILRCIPLIAKLHFEGIKFEWHIVGEGKQADIIRKTIGEYGLQDVVILEGQHTNPYRYMKNADYLFLPSFHEAAPIVFDEAIALNLPILTTETLSAQELVAQRNIGFVCKNTLAGIYEMLHFVLTSEDCAFETITINNELNLANWETMCCNEEVD